MTYKPKHSDHFFSRSQVVLAFTWLAWALGAVIPLLGQDAEVETNPSSVGAAETTSQEEVKLSVWEIQTLLNQVPHASGGPKQPLDVDGKLGPLTKAAMVRFQKIQLGSTDGKFESAAATRLLEFKDFEKQDRAGRQVVWGARVTGAFKTRMLEVCESVELDPDHLMAAMAFESAGSFSPAIKNAEGSGATGLIQFMPSTAKGLGTTTEALSKMSAVEQLDYVEKYFKPYKGRCKTLSDVYMAILWPAAIGKPEDHVLFDQATRPKTYSPNKGLDLDRNGEITKREAASMVQSRLEKGAAFRR